MNVDEIVSEIMELDPEAQALVLAFLELLEEAERAGISLPPVPAVGEEARA